MAWGQSYVQLSLSPSPVLSCMACPCYRRGPGDEANILWTIKIHASRTLMYVRNDNGVVHTPEVITPQGESELCS